MMKIFEIAWLTIAILAIGMFFYRIIFDQMQAVHVFYLLLVAALAVMMYFIKNKNRKFLEKRQNSNVSQRDY